MKQEVFYLSQTMLKSWETMCSLAFSKKYFGSDKERKIFELHESDAVRWGIHFETLIAGTGMGGKTIEYTASEKKSVKYNRAREQAKLCRDYLKALDGKMVATQELLQASYEWEGRTIYIQGNLDIRWRYNDPDKQAKGAVIDLKTTGDIDNTFGPFQWGDPDKIDVTQLIHYGLLYELNFGHWPDTYYLVFDLTDKMKFQPFKVNISEWTIEAHKERVAKAYQEITESLAIGYWEPKPEFSECKQCPIRDVCKFANRFPEITVLEF